MRRRPATKEEKELDQRIKNRSTPIRPKTDQELNYIKDRQGWKKVGLDRLKETQKKYKDPETAQTYLTNVQKAEDIHNSTT